MCMNDELDDTTDDQLQHIRRPREGGMTLASAQKFIAAYRIGVSETRLITQKPKG